MLSLKNKQHFSEFEKHEDGSSFGLRNEMRRRRFLHCGKRVGPLNCLIMNATPSCVFSAEIWVFICWASVQTTIRGV